MVPTHISLLVGVSNGCYRFSVCLSVCLSVSLTPSFSFSLSFCMSPPLSPPSLSPPLSPSSLFLSLPALYLFFLHSLSLPLLSSPLHLPSLSLSLSPSPSLPPSLSLPPLSIPLSFLSPTGVYPQLIRVSRALPLYPPKTMGLDFS